MNEFDGLREVLAYAPSAGNSDAPQVDLGKIMGSEHGVGNKDSILACQSNCKGELGEVVDRGLVHEVDAMSDSRERAPRSELADLDRRHTGCCGSGHRDNTM